MTSGARAAQLALDAMAASFVLFLGALRDARGEPYRWPDHVLVWAALLEREPHLVLRAPRGHLKTTVVLAFAAWHCWRHGRLRDYAAKSGRLEILTLSATEPQSLDLMFRFRELLLDNAQLFADLLPDSAPTSRRSLRWAADEIGLGNGARVRARAFTASLRGAHPDLLLLDDVLNETNSLTIEAREKVLRHFMGTLHPMGAPTIVLIGTALHQEDLLSHLSQGMGTGLDPAHTPLGFHAVTFRALDEVTREVLWPERFSAEILLRIRDEDPLAFSREYQNAPRDELSSLIPYAVSQRAIDAGAALVLPDAVARGADEFVVAGVDPARSAAAGADYTAIMVVAWDVTTGTRRAIDIRREKGVPFDQQVELVRDLVIRHRVSRAVVENNGFQQWLIDRLELDPQIRGRVVGHRTGLAKGDLRDGIPRLARELQSGAWVLPSGDSTSLRMARLVQEELGSFVYRDGRMLSVGRHDDLAIAAWLVEVGIQSLLDEAAALPTYEIVTAEELGIERVRIGDYW